MPQTAEARRPPPPADSRRAKPATAAVPRSRDVGRFERSRRLGAVAEALARIRTIHQGR
jgi:hypothetical protein